MGWDEIGHEDKGEYFRSRIIALRPTLLELYQKTRSFHAEWSGVADWYTRAQAEGEGGPESYEGELALRHHEHVEELLEGRAFLDAANAYAQAFVMVVDPALKELKTSVDDLFVIGPFLHDDIRLSEALWKLAGTVRHGHPGTSHVNETLTGLGIKPKAIDAPREFIMQWCPATYRPFERTLLEIGYAATVWLQANGKAPGF